MLLPDPYPYNVLGWIRIRNDWQPICQILYTQTHITQVNKSLKHSNSQLTIRKKAHIFPCRCRGAQAHKFSSTKLKLYFYQVLCKGTFYTTSDHTYLMKYMLNMNKYRERSKSKVNIPNTNSMLNEWML